jgi:hypothetical protein
MCLTIPKKVISREGDFFIVENLNGDKQKVKSIVAVKKGDSVITLQNMIVQKISKKEVEFIKNNVLRK